MTHRLTRIIAFGAISVVIFDCVASLASKQSRVEQGLYYFPAHLTIKAP